MCAEHHLSPAIYQILASENPVIRALGMPDRRQHQAVLFSREMIDEDTPLQYSRQPFVYRNGWTSDQAESR